MDRVRNMPDSYGRFGYTAARWTRGQNSNQGAGIGVNARQNLAKSQNTTENFMQESMRNPRQNSGQDSAWNFMQYHARESVWTNMQRPIQEPGQRETQNQTKTAGQTQEYNHDENIGQAKEQSAVGNMGQNGLQTSEQNTIQDFMERFGKKNAKEYVANSKDIITQLREEAQALKKAFDPKNRKNLYDATMDLTLVEKIEKIPGLKAIQSRLMFQIRAVRASGAEASEIRAAVGKLKKVISKVKKKVKCLQKENQLEKKSKHALEARQKQKARALRREKELRKKVRKIRERHDVEESRMGLGANYGGPAGENALTYLTEAYQSADAAATEVGTAVDVAVGDGSGAAVEASAGAVNVGV